MNTNLIVSKIHNSDITIKIKSDYLISTLCENNNIIDVSVVHDKLNNKITVAYDYWKDNEYYGIVVIGTVDSDNNTILFGNPIVFSNNYVTDITVVYSKHDKVVITYYDNNTKSSNIIIGTIIDNNNIVFTKPVMYDNVYTDYISVIYDHDNDKIIMAYRTSNFIDDYVGIIVTGTVVNDTITFNKPVVFNNIGTYSISIAYNMANNKLIISYQKRYNKECYSNVVLCNIVNDNIVLSKPIVFKDHFSGNVSVIYNKNSDKVIMLYCDGDNRFHGTVIIGTINNDTIVFNNPIIFNNDITTILSIIHDSDNSKITIVYRNDSCYVTNNIITGIISGNDIVFNKPTIL